MARDGTSGYLSISDGDGEQGSGKAYTYEEAVKETGYGKFHIILLLLCGWAVSSDAIEVLSVSFLLPSAECDLKLNSVDKGWLNAIVFIGMMVGGYFWGSLSDVKGRRAILMWSLTVNGLGGLASSFSQTFWLFLLLRFFSGVGVGGSIPVIFSYFVEFQPCDKRGKMVSLLATFWMTGNLIAAGLAWAVIPHPNFGFTSTYFVYNNWRIFVALCTIPSLSSAFLVIFMPESPKFLMKNGRSEEALEVFKKMHKMNHFYSQDFMVKKLQRDDNKYEKDLTEITGEPHSISTLCLRTKHSLKKIFHATVEVFQPPLRRTMIVSIIIYFTLSFGYYGLWMWYPELFSRVEANGGSVCSDTDDNDTSNATDNCDNVLDTRIFWEGFITASSNLPGNIFSIFLMDKLGRRFLLGSSMAVAGVSVFFIPVVTTRAGNLALSCAFGGISVIGWNALDVLAVELFPTHLRSSSMGVLTGVGRIAAILGNTVFGALVDVHCAVPLIVISVLLVIGGLTAIKLPNTTNTELQ